MDTEAGAPWAFDHVSHHRINPLDLLGFGPPVERSDRSIRRFALLGFDGAVEHDADRLLEPVHLHQVEIVPAELSDAGVEVVGVVPRVDSAVIGLHDQEAAGSQLVGLFHHDRMERILLELPQLLTVLANEF